MKRKNSWIWRIARGGCTHHRLRTRAIGGSTEALKQDVRSPPVRLSNRTDEDISLFLHVLPFLWVSRCFWLLSRGFTDGYFLYTCWTVGTMPLYVDLAATPESFITLSLSLAGAKWVKKKKKKEMFLFSSCFSIVCVSGRALVVLLVLLSTDLKKDTRYIWELLFESDPHLFWELAWCAECYSKCFVQVTYVHKCICTVAEVLLACFFATSPCCHGAMFHRPFYTWWSRLLVYKVVGCKHIAESCKIIHFLSSCSQHTNGHNTPFFFFFFFIFPDSACTLLNIC